MSECVKFGNTGKDSEGLAILPARVRAVIIGVCTLVGQAVMTGPSNLRAGSRNCLAGPYRVAETFEE